jgi:hypothetical protein
LTENDVKNYNIGIQCIFLRGDSPEKKMKEAPFFLFFNAVTDGVSDTPTRIYANEKVRSFQWQSTHSLLPISSRPWAARRT